MSLNDAPPFRQPHPDLALAAVDLSGGSGALELQSDAGEVAAKRHYVQPGDGAGQIGRGPSLPKRFQLPGAVKILRDAKPHDFRTGPKHCDQSLHVVGHKSMFIAGIELGELGDNLRVVDCHCVGNSSLAGRICLLMAALTV